MQDNFIITILAIYAVCYIVARFSSIAASSRDRKIEEEKEDARKKKLDSLYGR